MNYQPGYAQLPSGLFAPLQLDSSKNLNVNVQAGTISATNPSVGPTGTTVPADATYIGGLNSGNLVPLLLDSSGRAYVLLVDGGGSGNAQKVDSNKAAWVAQTLGGAVLSATNPEPNISNIQQMILNGSAWSVSSAIFTPAASAAFQFFVTNANTKNIILWDIRSVYTNANQTADIRYITSLDGSITTQVSNAYNLKLGGGSPGSTWSFYYGANGTPTGNPLDVASLGVQNTNEDLLNGGFIYIPPGVAAGIAVYTSTTAAGKFGCSVKWVEY